MCIDLKIPLCAHSPPVWRGFGLSDVYIVLVLALW